MKTILRGLAVVTAVCLGVRLAAQIVAPAIPLMAAVTLIVGIFYWLVARR